MNWEDTFHMWARPPSLSELDKATHAERAIRRAITDDKTLSKMDIEVIPQGSYRANTNVRLDSDVDICVCLKNPFFCDYPPGKTQEDFGNVESEMTYQEFKGLVESALVHEFGRRSVTRGNKAFDVHENTYRIDADVVAALAHRRYTCNNDGTYHYIIPPGVELHPDNGGRVINWPEQTYANGVAKNEETGRRYKGIVRILKRLRNEMQDKKIAEANNIGSFLIESLVWNVPNTRFGYTALSDDVKHVLAYCFVNTEDDEKCGEWGEVNELKYLFRPMQPWTRQQANSFLLGLCLTSRESSSVYEKRLSADHLEQPIASNRDFLSLLGITESETEPVDAESQDEIVQHLEHFHDIYEHSEIVEIIESQT